ncbi:hypothetical protein PIB30_043868 [Stylosanthes scabra]|uniref:Late endosomal/lysosomal adaptor and MAPK and MTOR activator 5 n=1 Tax=Stylosanthes scabra TaxID=79078 RepID=A0ABU6QG82_9FABA|nr:hypothetical protein [Stylosanthes scabra]
MLDRLTERLCVDGRTTALLLCDADGLSKGLCVDGRTDGGVAVTELPCSAPATLRQLSMRSCFAWRVEAAMMMEERQREVHLEKRRPSKMNQETGNTDLNGKDELAYP